MTVRKFFCKIVAVLKCNIFGPSLTVTLLASLPSLLLKHVKSFPQLSVYFVKDISEWELKVYLTFRLTGPLRGGGDTTRNVAK